MCIKMAKRQKNCAKCKLMSPTVVLNSGDAFCRDCFLGHVEHKFRAVLGKTRSVAQHKETLFVVPLSGSLVSMTLANLVFEHQRIDAEQVMFMFIPTNGCKTDDATLSLLPRDNCCVADLDALLFDATPELCSLKDYCSNGFTTSSARATALVSAVTSDVSLRQSVAYRLRRVALLRAVHLCRLRRSSVFKSAVLLVPESRNFVANRALSAVALGRPASDVIATCSSTQSEISACCSVVRPLCDLSDKEISMYAHLKKVVYAPTQGEQNVLLSSHPSPPSIQSTTSAFLSSLMTAGFPSSANTVMNCMQKITEAAGVRAMCELCTTNNVTGQSLCDECLAVLLGAAYCDTSETIASCSQLIMTALSTKFTFRHPDEQNKTPLCDEDRTGSTGPVAVNNQYAALSLQQQRQRLPIFQHRNHILYLLETHQTLVIIGETGCGKSTQIPQYMVEVGWSEPGTSCIAVTQPRRVAAVSLASRVADERSTLLGHEVGYAVRFDECADQRSTRIKYVTDGLLLREMMSDPLLRKYSAIMIDECHERSLNSDLILGLIRKIARKRTRAISAVDGATVTELKVIVSSATFDAELYRDFFNFNEMKEDRTRDTAVILGVQGRCYPVEIMYARTPQPDYVQATANAILRIHRTEPAGGDILAFLTGQDEVEEVLRQLKAELQARGKNDDPAWVLPLYGALSMKDQMRVFDSATGKRTRKIVVATNVAETSLTVPGVVYVVDCGFVKLRARSASTGMETLMVVPVSKACAVQRAGRAGRLRAGKAFRLYTEESYTRLRECTPAEIERCNLSALILQMKALGIENILRFHYLSPPPARAVVDALDDLHALGALDDGAALTEDVGLPMAELPLPPMHAKALLSAKEHGCVGEMLTIVAMLQVQDVFAFAPGKKHAAEMSKRRFSVAEGDHLTLLNVFNAWNTIGNRESRFAAQHHLNHRALRRAAEIRLHLERTLRRFNLSEEKKQRKRKLGKNDIDYEDDEDDPEAKTINILRCLTAAFFSQAAKLHYTGVYYTIRENEPLKLYPGSSAFYRDRLPEYVVYTELLQDCARDVSVVELDWLTELAPHYYQYTYSQPEADAAKRRKMEV